jgi:signal transduction histidine kinase
MLTANELVQYTSWAVYVLIFVSTTIKAVRRPLRVNIDIALFFLIPALIILQVNLQAFGIEPTSPLFTALTVVLFPIMVYMLLRVADDFSTVPPWLMHASEVALAVQAIAAFYFAPTIPPWLLLFLLTYLVASLAYATVIFVRQARKTKGVTSRRMSAAAIGTIFLCLNIMIPTITRPLTDWADAVQLINSIVGLASGISYFIGFSPPNVLRTAWQDPELRAFLSRATSLARLPTTEDLVTEFEKGAAQSIGTPEASIGLWVEQEQALLFRWNGRTTYVPVTEDSLTGRVFLTQKPFFSENLNRDSAYAARTGQPYVTFLSAPISTQAQKFGVLVAYATHTPVFGEEDIRLVALLADQAAVLLESRALIDESLRLRTREEITRLKEDFLSAAAHDLKTPLTSLVAQAQLLERRAERKPDAPADIEGLRTIAREATRLKGLVLELLDAARAEEGKLLGELQDFDLVLVAEEICARHTSDHHPCKVEADGAIMGTFDLPRIRQLLENLMENAIKYSPDGGEVHLKLWTSGDNAFFSIRDHGIGIPASDFSSIFERFHRGTNIDDRRFAGMGLGLYICREIVKQHNGKISVTSHRGEGTTFTVELPLSFSKSAAPDSQTSLTNEVQPLERDATREKSKAEGTLPNLAVGQMPFAGQEEG